MLNLRRITTRRLLLVLLLALMGALALWAGDAVPRSPYQYSGRHARGRGWWGRGGEGRPPGPARGARMDPRLRVWDFPTRHPAYSDEDGHGELGEYYQGRLEPELGEVGEEDEWALGREGNGSWSWSGQDGLRQWRALCPELASPMHAGVGVGVASGSGSGKSGSGDRRPAKHPLDKTLAELRAMVRGTAGYYVRDWSLWLGWNNMRYIIETALHQAALLNRTLVLPSFVYARDCEFEHEVCSSFATLVNRAASGSDEWRTLPAEDQQGWRIPISLMFTLPPTYAIMTTAQFLALHGLSPLRERADGQWDPQAYFAPGPEAAGEARTMAYIPVEEYDPERAVRIDRLPPAPAAAAGEAEADAEAEAAGEGTVPLNQTLVTALDAVFVSATQVPWTRLRDLVFRTLPLPASHPPSVPATPSSVYDNDTVLAALLRPYGIAPLFQFSGRALDLTKAVSQPYKAWGRREAMDGWVDDFARVGERVLWLQGEVHSRRRPGSMWFSTAEARDAYARLVLREMRFPEVVEVVAERMAGRMAERVQGRMWMAAHMRRGDFVTVKWTQSVEFDLHVDRVKRSLALGRKTLQKLAREDWSEFRLPEVAGVRPWLAWKGAEPPRGDDPFYVATDERNTTNLAHLRSAGALLLPDLLTPEDRQLLGPAAVLTDYVSLVEQAVMLRAAFWAGHAVTSVSGTVANGRAGRGCDVRTTVVDT